MHIALSHLEILSSTGWKYPTLQTAQETPSYIYHCQCEEHCYLKKNVIFECFLLLGRFTPLANDCLLIALPIIKSLPTL